MVISVEVDPFKPRMFVVVTILVSSLVVKFPEVVKDEGGWVVMFSLNISLVVPLVVREVCISMVELEVV